MTEKTLTTENIKPALDALRGELAPWPVVAKKQDRLNTAQLNAANSGITSSLVAQIIANTAAIRALESAITGTGLRALVVATLPAVGTTGILYIVPVTTYDPDTDADVVNYSNEYIWIPVEGGTASEGHYEQVGQTGIVINNGQLTITVNGTSVGTFTANQSGDTTAAITVPTNADYVDRTTNQTIAGTKTFSSTIEGTASKAIADEDGTSIKTGYGKLAGNNTWTGNNTFNGIKSTGAVRVEKSSGDTEFEIVNGEVDATTNTLSRQDDIRFYDKNTKITGGLRLTYTTDTGTKIELYARSWKADGTASYNRSLTIYTNGQTGEYYTTLETNFQPKNTNTYSLGSSSYQWSSVYAQTYYYNGTAWGLDKANIWGNTQTVTGNDKGWNIINPDIEKGVIPNANKSSYVWWTDKNNNFLGRICSRVQNDGSTILWLSSLNYYKNGTLDPTGSSATTFLILGVDANAYKFVKVNANFIPDVTNTTDLGTSTNQWNKTYSKEYYYNGTAWGLDKANTWTGSNTFNSNIKEQLNYTIGETPATDSTKAIQFVSSSGSQLISVSGMALASGANIIQISAGDRFADGVKSPTGTIKQCGLQIGTRGNGDRFLYTDGLWRNNLTPYESTLNLGTSTNKWKTINGINPGALSLPDYNSTAKVDISGSIIPDQYGNIVYTPPINGWLYVCFNVSNATTSDSIFYIQAKDNNVANSSFVQTSWMPTSGTSSLAIFFPVVANKRFVIQINFSNYTIIKAHVIPCLGNV